MWIEIRQTDRFDVDLRKLTKALDDELLTLYPAEGIFGLDLDDPSLDSALFAVAYLGGVPAGCGAIKPVGREYAELKRFYVDPTFRKKGIATAVLNYLENEAAAGGFGLIRLETGPKQPEALNLYTKSGYTRIGRFGDYPGDEYSVFFEKHLKGD